MILLGVVEVDICVSEDCSGEHSIFVFAVELRERADKLYKATIICWGGVGTHNAVSLPRYVYGVRTGR